MLQRGTVEIVIAYLPGTCWLGSGGHVKAWALGHAAKVCNEQGSHCVSSMPLPVEATSGNVLLCRVAEELMRAWHSLCQPCATASTLGHTCLLLCKDH